MRYLGKMSKMAVKFMEDILKMEPSERLTTIEALRHPYFKGLNSEFISQKPKSRELTSRKLMKKSGNRAVSLETNKHGGVGKF